MLWFILTLAVKDWHIPIWYPCGPPPIHTSQGDHSQHKADMSNSQGWISLHRTLQDHKLWKGEKFTRGQAWVDLLLGANHKPAEIIIKGIPLKLERGEQARSQLTLSKEWKWSRDKVKRYVRLLEKEQMITIKTSQLTSIITICNYSGYQDTEIPNKSTDKAPNESPDQQQTNIKRVTDNNDNNDNKNTYSENSGNSSPIPYQKIVDLYHEKLSILSKVQTLTGKRKGQIRQRWKSGQLPDLETWGKYFEFVAKSQFLTGMTPGQHGRKPFRADLEWITNEANFVKIWERKYHEQ